MCIYLSSSNKYSMSNYLLLTKSSIYNAVSQVIHSLTFNNVIQHKLNFLTSICKPQLHNTVAFHSLNNNHATITATTNTNCGLCFRIIEVG